MYVFYVLFQIYSDPFEEIGMAEKNAEQHRRSASEKEVWTFLAYSFDNVIHILAT